MIDDGCFYKTPLEVNPSVPPSLTGGAPEARDMLCRSPDEVVPMGPDWSSLMTDLHKSLTRAEEQLRLIHMDPKNLTKARCHLVVARHTLMQLESWTKEKS